jgi:hypothetical protein
VSEDYISEALGESEGDIDDEVISEDASVADVAESPNAASRSSMIEEDIKASRGGMSEGPSEVRTSIYTDVGKGTTGSGRSNRHQGSKDNYSDSFESAISSDIAIGSMPKDSLPERSGSSVATDIPESARSQSGSVSGAIPESISEEQISREQQTTSRIQESINESAGSVLSSNIQSGSQTRVESEDIRESTMPGTSVASNAAHSVDQSIEESIDGRKLGGTHNASMVASEIGSEVAADVNRSHLSVSKQLSVKEDSIADYDDDFDSMTEKDDKESSANKRSSSIPASPNASEVASELNQSRLSKFSAKEGSVTEDYEQDFDSITNDNEGSVKKASATSGIASDIASEVPSDLNQSRVSKLSVKDGDSFAEDYEPDFESTGGSSKKPESIPGKLGSTINSESQLGGTSSSLFAEAEHSKPVDSSPLPKAGGSAAHSLVSPGSVGSESADESIAEESVAESLGEAYSDAFASDDEGSAATPQATAKQRVSADKNAHQSATPVTDSPAAECDCHSVLFVCR